MNSLREYFLKNDKRLIHKWDHYFEIYDRHFSKYIGKEVVILEIGVSHGGSLQMWKDYFGSKAIIYGVDINPSCKELEEENISIFIGSQSDKNFLRELKSKIGKVDILIDDGGHMVNQQIVSFEELYSIVADNGIYLCEDVHTSYWLRFGGGVQRSGTFIEYSKNLIDHLNAYHSEQKSRLDVTEFTNKTDSIHFYDSVVVLEKRIKSAPFHLKRGEIIIDHVVPEKGPARKFLNSIFIPILVTINRVLRFFRLPSIYWK